MQHFSSSKRVLKRGFSVQPRGVRLGVAMVVLASLALVFLLFPFASSIVDCCRGLLGFGEFCFTTLTPSIFGSGCRCPSSLDTCLPFVLVFFCLPLVDRVRGVWFSSMYLPNSLSACFFHGCLALGGLGWGILA